MHQFANSGRVFEAIACRVSAFAEKIKIKKASLFFCYASTPVCLSRVCAKLRVRVCVASAVNGPLRFPWLAVKEGNDL